MDDLISRQAAIDAIEPTIKSILQGNSFKAINVMDKIRELPSAQPERKTGRWETAMLDHEAFGVRPKVLYCSECNQCIAYPTRYCPNCGAKMEVEHETD